MKIEIKTRGSRECYDEFMYILSNYKKFRNNPHSKIMKLSDFIRSYTIYCALAIVLMFVFYLIFKNTLFLVFIGMIVILLLILLMQGNRMNTSINNFLNSDETKTVEIDKDAVSYSDSKKQLRINWSEISNVIIGKECICFLPNDINNMCLCVSKEYLSEVLEGIKEAGKEDLIVSDQN